MKKEKVDFAIVTALEVECKAMLGCLDEYKQDQKDNERTYYHGYINLPETKERYEIIVVLLPEMGNVDAGIVATQIIERWQPLNMIMVGIAGGICSQVKLGDVVIAKYVFYYELAKLAHEGNLIRPRQYDCHPLLYDRYQNLKLNWAPEISTKLPKIHFGPIASGEKVIANDKVLSILRGYCPELKAVGMEGAGIARAAMLAVLAHHQTRFLEIRGISDCADSDKNDDYRKSAANAAANFTIALLRSRPFTPLKTNFLEKWGFFSFCRGVLSLIQRFLKVLQESSERKEILQTSTQPESSEGQEILQTSTQLMERLGLSEQLKLSDEFIPYDNNRRQQIQEIQTKLKRLSLDDPKYNRILMMTGCVLSSTGDPTKVAEAEYWFSQVRENSPDDGERALASFNLFQMHLRHKLYDKALDDLKVAIEIDPQRYALHNVHKYPIEKLLGAGGMGCVFLCQNRDPLILDERVVVKCFWENRKGSPNEVFKEALAMSKVAGQYVPKPLTCGHVDDIKQERAFFVTEYIHGMIDGENWLKRKGKLDLEMALKVGLEIAKGLQVAHCARIYHLDLKPANILLKPDKKKIAVKIIDFGLSHVATSLRQQAARRQSQIGLSVLGQKVVGTLDYASPEQLDPKHSEKPGAKSDIFGFGTTMYHLLTGEKPNPFLEGELPEIPILRNLLGDCVKKEPSQRPQSARQLVHQWMQLFPKHDVLKPKSSQYYEERCILQDHIGAVWSIAFSPDGCILASGSNDGSIKLWNVSMDEVLQTLTGHGQAVYSVAFSPDGRILASGSNNKTVKLWNVDTGQVLQTLQRHEGKVHSVVFNPTKRLLVSGSDDKTILWEVDANTSKDI